MFSLEYVVGGLFALILGGYAYTWKSISSLWRAFQRLESNHLPTIQRRLAALDQRMDTQDTRMDGQSDRMDRLEHHKR